MLNHLLICQTVSILLIQVSRKAFFFNRTVAIIEDVFCLRMLKQYVEDI